MTTLPAQFMRRTRRGYVLPEFLPGALRIDRGTAREYDTLAPFHYVNRRPATWASIRVIRYQDPCAERVVAVGVLSYPVPQIAARARYLGLHGATRAEQLQFANRSIRTISRVIVHPQFRSLGLASALIDCLCDDCTTRYVEAVAHMGRASPMFVRAGFLHGNADFPEEPAYFLLDRGINHE